MTGTSTGGAITGTASGTLNGTGVPAVAGDATVELTLNGTTRSFSGTADSIYGTASGTASGAFDLTISDGVFYGVD